MLASRVAVSSSRRPSGWRSRAVPQVTRRSCAERGGRREVSAFISFASRRNAPALTSIWSAQPDRSGDGVCHDEGSLTTRLWEDQQVRSALFMATTSPALRSSRLHYLLVEWSSTARLLASLASTTRDPARIGTTPRQQSDRFDTGMGHFAEVLHPALGVHGAEFGAASREHGRGGCGCSRSRSNGVGTP